ncbi:MAG: signal peptide peptidase SppA [Candidatus Dasytiphilus stammeri]
MKTVLPKIGTFLRKIWWILNWIRECICNIFIVFLLIMIVNVFLLFNKHNSIKIKEPYNNSSPGVLLLDINTIIKDVPNVTDQTDSKIYNWFNRIIQNNSQENGISLFDLVEAIRQAKSDPNISSIVLDLSNFDEDNTAVLDYIGKALKEFKAHGKLIYSMNDNYTQPQYYLASYANKIYLSPSGEVDLHGCSTENLYFKDFLDKLQLKPYIFRVGDYKSAVEPFVRNNMSLHVRKEREHLLNDLWNHLLKNIADNRHMTVEQIFPEPHEILRKLRHVGMNGARYAYRNQLVDELITQDDFNSKMIKKFGWNKNHSYYNHINIHDYILKLKSHQSKLKNLNKHNRIGIFKVNGMILDTNGFDGLEFTNAWNIVEDIREANNNPDFKGFILNIDSPGGSVYASELIREALREIRKSGKPLVVVMGSMAASGGYLISLPANYIIANPNTITGSIGVFSIFTTIGKALDKMGIHYNTILSSPLSTAPGVLPSHIAPLTPEQENIMQIRVEHIYDNFTYHVASARKLSQKYVDTIGQGRVWSGTDAKRLGLIDAIGDFDDAISKVVELAKLKKWQVEWIHHHKKISWKKELIKFIISKFKPESKINMINMIKTNYNNKNPAILLNQYLIMLKESLSDYPNIYAQCIICSNSKLS